MNLRKKDLPDWALQLLLVGWVNGTHANTNCKPHLKYGTALSVWRSQRGEWVINVKQDGLCRPNGMYSYHTWTDATVMATVLAMGVDDAGLT